MSNLLVKSIKSILSFQLPPLYMPRSITRNNKANAFAESNVHKGSSTF